LARAVGRREFGARRAAREGPGGFPPPEDFPGRDRAALADRRAADLLALEQRFEQFLGIQRRIERREPIGELLQHRALLLLLEIGDDPARVQKVGELQDLAFLRLSVDFVLCFRICCSILSISRSIAEYRSVVSSRPCSVTPRACIVSSATCRPCDSTARTTCASSGRLKYLPTL